MSKEQQETLLQTIKARLERAEDGRIQWISVNDGHWNLAHPDSLTKGRLIKYFEPAYQEGYDEYGTPITSNKK